MPIQQDDTNPTNLVCSSEDSFYMSDEEADVVGKLVVRRTTYLLLPKTVVSKALTCYIP